MTNDSTMYSSIDRCNSLNTLNSPQKTLITIAESEKQLVKADFEAFIKYRELITEAETLLGSFANHQANTATATAAVIRNHQHSHLPNKRVEMLRAEVGSKRSVDVLTSNSNSHHNNSGNVKPPGPSSSHKLSPSSCHNMKPHVSSLSPLPVHRKIELLKQEQYAFGPPQPSSSSCAKENHPPPHYSPRPQHRIPVAEWTNCPKSEPLKRKVYVPPSSSSSGNCNQELMLLRNAGSNKNLKQEMILKTLADLKRSLEDQKTQLYTLNEKP